MSIRMGLQRNFAHNLISLFFSFHNIFFVSPELKFQAADLRICVECCRKIGNVSISGLFGAIKLDWKGSCGELAAALEWPMAHNHHPDSGAQWIETQTPMLLCIYKELLSHQNQAMKPLHKWNPFELLLSGGCLSVAGVQDCWLCCNLNMGKHLSQSECACSLIFLIAYQPFCNVVFLYPKRFAPSVGI